ncbi:hypothetical protein HNQ91_002970 [Filimonas zeae]|nr:caspase family protein [Filimonas zeae]MDR6339905.1 hypothetical protein [Filimonas zeae]
MHYKLIGIAINEYDDPILNTINNCTNDLQTIIAILTSQYLIDDFELLSGKEQTTQNFIYHYLFDTITNSLKEDCIIIIYAGHGEYIQKLNTTYWQTSDSKATDSTTWFNLDNLLKFMKASEASHISLISDSCFSGTLLQDNYRGGGIKAIENFISRELLASGGNEKVSDGALGGHSPFSETLCSALKDNIENELPFSNLAGIVVRNFDEKRKQTPVYGSFINAGHQGGSLILRLKNKSKQEKEVDSSLSDVKDITIPLNLQLPYKINYSCTIPFFQENSIFNYQFVNNYVQQIAYQAINNARKSLHQHQEELSPRNETEQFDLFIGYTIQFKSDLFLSLSISVETYFGYRPTNQIYTLNFSFKPELKLSISDLIDYTSYPSFKDFLSELIMQYASDETQQDILLRHAEFVNPYEADFMMNADYITFVFTNELPRAVMSYSFFEVPLSALMLKVGI